MASCTLARVRTTEGILRQRFNSLSNQNGGYQGWEGHICITKINTDTLDLFLSPLLKPLRPRLT